MDGRSATRVNSHENFAPWSGTSKFSTLSLAKDGNNRHKIKNAPFIQPKLKWTRTSTNAEVVALLAEMDEHANDCKLHHQLCVMRPPSTDFAHSSMTLLFDENEGGVMSSIEIATFFEQGMLLLMVFNDGVCRSPRNSLFGPCVNCRSGNKGCWKVAPIAPCDRCEALNMRMVKLYKGFGSSFG